MGSNEGSDTTLQNAKKQLLSFMKAVREAKDSSEEETLYGIVTIGHYSRYCTVSPDGDSLLSFRPRRLQYDGEPLHFKDDEQSIHTLLTELVELTSQ